MDQNTPTPYKYIWRDYSQLPYQSLILTLNGYQALSLLAFVSAFIAYAQTRWWIITRYLLIRILRPVQLPVSDDAASLQRLSQGKAIKSLIFKEKGRYNDSMVSISPWFGTASLFNVLLFIVLGTIIPYYLTGGLGPVKVQSHTTDACDGFEAYSPDAMQLAQSFYIQCRLNAPADATTCGYKARIVESRPQLNFTVDSQCPFAEGSCERFKPQRWNRWKEAAEGASSLYNEALRIEYLDMRPSEYGLNADGRIRQSHSLTCAPVKVRQFQLPYGTRGDNATVLWVGYTPGDFNVSETFPSTGESVHYWPGTLVQPAPFKLKSATVYELIIYPVLMDRKPWIIFENFHPGLKSYNGDMFFVMFKFGVGPNDTPAYSAEREGFLSYRGDTFFNRWGTSTYALGCFEQYNLCFDERCTGWSNATDATGKMFQFLQSNYGHDIASEVIKIQSLLTKAAALQNFMQHHHRSSMMVRALSPDLDVIYGNSSNRQWHWEVQSWFEMAFLTVKFSLLASVQGEKKNSVWSSDHFSNTSWICNKLLFLDNDSTNINFIGLMATLSGLLVIYLVSMIRRILVWIKHGLGICWKVCQWVRAVLRRLWKDLLHDLAFAYRWIQGAFEFVAERPKAVLQAMRRGLGLFAGFVVLPFRRSSAYRPRYSNYDDDEMPSISASIGLESLPQ